MKLEIRQFKHGNKTLLGVIKQDKTGFRFSASNGIVVRSDSFPEWREETDTFFVRGSANDKDNNLVYVPQNRIQYILNAVSEYNGGARKILSNKLAEEDIRIITVEFNSKISKDDVDALLEYWAAPAYLNGAVISTQWWNLPVGMKLSIHFDISRVKTPSRDITAHNILGKLESILVNGSPKRKTMGNSRAVYGVGNKAIKSISTYT